MDMHFQQLHEMDLRTVVVSLSTDPDCNPCEGEYSMHLLSMDGALDLSSIGGVDDISLAIDGVKNHFDFKSMKPEVDYIVTLKESGEWEDVFWHKYYLIEAVEEMPWSNYEPDADSSEIRATIGEVKQIVKGDE